MAEGDARAAKVLRLAEWYFGDINYPNDQWLKEKIEESGGMIDISHIIKFGRMAPLDVSVEEFYEICKDSEVLSFSSDHQKVKRKNAAPEKPAINDEAALYFKGLPSTLTLDDLEEFFATIAPFKMIQMRRLADRTFKGSCYVQFADKEAAEKILADKPKYKDTELFISTKADHVAEDTAKRASKRKAPKAMTSAELEYKAKTVLIVDGIPADADVSREDISAEFKKFGELAFVAFSRGKTNAEVRFAETGMAEKALPEVNGKLVLGGATVTARTLEEEEEKEYFAKIQSRATEKGSRGRKNFRARRE
ncbi:RNA binding motif protein [Carpediemonas membranifera]|uniref:RNA binding motif protein n=1 Tax=Carpediemonas membranifera TaxID=201153 RepID=A0A8J6E4N8_9EUKA|nr:RNA binding motif protein [Carpediemonas membranifera]|eukprot:KAG9397181.1 RNA binding motif protein [Carpediemonas membranifera]